VGREHRASGAFWLIQPPIAIWVQIGLNSQGSYLLPEFQFKSSLRFSASEGHPGSIFRYENIINTQPRRLGVNWVKIG